MFHWNAGPKAKVMPLPSKTRLSLFWVSLLWGTLAAAVPKVPVKLNAG